MVHRSGRVAKLAGAEGGASAEAASASQSHGLPYKAASTCSTSPTSRFKGEADAAVSCDGETHDNIVGRQRSYAVKNIRPSALLALARALARQTAIDYHKANRNPQPREVGDPNPELPLTKSL